jgi:cobalamin biosynthesis protein CobT
MFKFRVLAGIHQEAVIKDGESKLMEYDAKNHPIVESDKPLDRMFVGKFVKVSDKKKASEGMDIAAQRPWLAGDGINSHRNLISPAEAAALEDEDDEEEEEEASPRLKKAMNETAKQRKEVAKLSAPVADDDEDEEEDEEEEPEDDSDDEEEEDEEPEEKPVKKTVAKPAKKTAKASNEGEDVSKDFKVATENDLTVLKNKDGGFIVKDGKKTLNEEGVPFKRSAQVREFLKAHVSD